MATTQSRSNRIPKSERRDQIVACATSLFHSRGFEDTTMDDIASAAGITKRTLYRYVQTKDQLLYDIHDKFSGTTLLADLSTLSDDPVERLEQLIDRHVRIVTGKTTEIAVFFDERKYLAGAQQREIGARRLEYETGGIKAIVAAQESGRFIDVDPRIAARAMFGSLTEIYRWYRPGGRLTPDQISASSIDVFLHGSAHSPLDIARIEAAAESGSLLRAARSRPVENGAKVRAAAVKSFATVGYRASSIREIAEAADVTKGAVMYHARYKHSLLEGIIIGVLEGGIDLVNKAKALGGAPVDVLVRMISAHVTFLSQHTAEIAVFNETIKYLEPQAQRKANSLHRRWLAQFSSAVSAGVEAGEMQVDDPDMFSRLLFGMLNSTYRWFRPAAGVNACELSIVYARILLLGLEGDGQP